VIELGETLFASLNLSRIPWGAHSLQCQKSHRRKPTEAKLLAQSLAAQSTISSSRMLRAQPIRTRQN